MPILDSNCIYYRFFSVFIKTLPNLVNLNIQEDDVCVMPFEEVKLLCDPSESLLNSLKMTDGPTVSYHRSQESIDFYLICDSSSAAQALADEFRLDPKFTLSNLQLNFGVQRPLLRSCFHQFIHSANQSTYFQIQSRNLHCPYSASNHVTANLSAFRLYFL